MQRTVLQKHYIKIILIALISMPLILNGCVGKNVFLSETKQLYLLDKGEVAPIDNLVCMGKGNFMRLERAANAKAIDESNKPSFFGIWDTLKGFFSTFMGNKDADKEV